LISDSGETGKRMYVYIYTQKQKQKKKEGQHTNIVIVIIIANNNLDVHNTPYKHNKETKTT